MLPLQPQRFPGETDIVWELMHWYVSMLLQWYPWITQENVLVSWNKQGCILELEHQLIMPFVWYMHMETRHGCWMSLFKIGSLTEPEARLAGQLTQGSAYSHLSSTGIAGACCCTLLFYIDTGNANPGLHACIVNTSPTKPSSWLQPLAFKSC